VTRLILLLPGSLLIAKALRIALFLYYTAALPKFRIALLTGALAILLPSALYIPLLFIVPGRATVILASLVIAVEMSVAYFLGASLHLRAARGVHIPAISVEHVIERTLQHLPHLVWFKNSHIWLSAVSQFVCSLKDDPSAICWCGRFRLIAVSSWSLG
jgi:hypothetical protein